MDKKSRELVEEVEYHFKIFCWIDSSFMESSNASKKLVLIGIDKFFTKFILYEMFTS